MRGAVTTRDGGAPLRRIEALADIAVHARAFASPVVGWRQVAAGLRAPGPAPAFVLGPMTAAAGRALFGQVDLPASGSFAVQDAAAGPGGVIVKDGLAFFGEGLDVSQAKATAVAQQLNARATTTLDVPGPLVSLVGGGPGAVLTRVMPLLWVLQASGYDVAKCQYLIPWDAPPDLVPLLLAFGLTEPQLVRCREAGDVVRAPRILAPASLRCGDRFAPAMGEATRFWTTRVAARVARTQAGLGLALFVSPQDDREPCGVADWQTIEAQATAAGMTAVHPALLDIGERVSLFAGASFVMGFDGADLLEAYLFAPAGAGICAIRGSAPRSFALLGVAQALGQGLGYVFGTLDPEDAEAPALVDPATVQQAITALSLVDR